VNCTGAPTRSERGFGGHRRFEAHRRGIDDREERRARRDDVAGVHRPVGDHAVERGAEHRVAELLTGRRQPRPGIGQLRLGGGDVALRHLEVALRRGRRPSPAARPAPPRAGDLELALGRLHRRLRRTPRILERRASIRASTAPRRTAWPSSAATCSTDPPSSARTVASFAARSSPEISGPAMIRSRATRQTFSWPTCTAGAAAGGCSSPRTCACTMLISGDDSAAMSGHAHGRAAIRERESAVHLTSLAESPPGPCLCAAGARGPLRALWGPAAAAAARRPGRRPTAAGRAAAPPARGRPGDRAPPARGSPRPAVAGAAHPTARAASRRPPRNRTSAISYARVACSTVPALASQRRARRQQLGLREAGVERRQLACLLKLEARLLRVRGARGHLGAALAPAGQDREKWTARANRPVGPPARSRKEGRWIRDVAVVRVHRATGGAPPAAVRSRPPRCTQRGRRASTAARAAVRSALRHHGCQVR
jgi:hypothetical protein